MNPELAVEKHIPPFERIRELKDWRQKRGLEVVLFDYDDTLANTSPVFDGQEKKFIEHCIQNIPDLTTEELHQIVREEHAISYEAKKVNPIIWDFLVDRLEARMGEKANGVFREGLHFLKEIYQIVPELMPNSRETLGIFKFAGFRTGLVTHGNEAWARLKLKKHKFESEFEHIEIANEDNIKSAKDWEKAINAFKIVPSKALVIGDNISADMLSAREAGVEYLVHIKPRFKVAQNGILPEGVLRADSIGDVIGVLLNNAV